MINQIKVPATFLSKIASFISISGSTISDLQVKLDSRLQKEAQDRRQNTELLKQAAEALYDADFLLDQYEKRDFIKESQDNPYHLAKILKRVCNAKDVATMGYATDIGIEKKAHVNDPIYNKVFGRGNSKGFGNKQLNYE